MKEQQFMAGEMNELVKKQNAENELAFKEGVQRIEKIIEELDVNGKIIGLSESSSHGGGSWSAEITCHGENEIIEKLAQDRYSKYITNPNPVFDNELIRSGHNYGKLSYLLNGQIIAEDIQGKQTKYEDNEEGNSEYAGEIDYRIFKIFDRDVNQETFSNFIEHVEGELRKKQFNNKLSTEMQEKINKRQKEIYQEIVKSNYDSVTIKKNENGNISFFHGLTNVDPKTIKIVEKIPTYSKGTNLGGGGGLVISAKGMDSDGNLVEKSFEIKQYGLSRKGFPTDSVFENQDWIELKKLGII